MSSAARPTLREVAAAAGVSVATCSYVLSGRSDRTRQLPEATQQRVRAAAQELGYAGNTAARVLRRQRTELIALVYAPPVGPWLDHLTMQCEDIAESHGYSVIGVPLRRPEHADRSLRVVTRGYVDGVIFAPGLADTLDLSSLQANTRAIVAFSERLSPGPAEVIRNHTRDALAEATAYLIERGHRRIGFIAHDDGRADDLYAGHLDAHRAAGITADPALRRPGASLREDALLAAHELLTLPDRPTALISESDRGGFAALQAARDLGLSVPGDVAVVGVGNTREATVSSPALTSVGMARFDFADVVEALFARIDAPELAARQLDVPWVLTERAST